MRIGVERKRLLLKEFKFSSSRSGGPGGQHVNKVNTKVELRFNLNLSTIFSPEEKSIIRNKMASKINSEGIIVMVSSSERSQWLNREKVCEKFFKLTEKALTPVKKRIKTSPTKSSKLKRVESKKLLSQKKQLRRKPDF